MILRPIVLVGRRNISAVKNLMYYVNAFMLNRLTLIILLYYNS